MYMYISTNIHSDNVSVWPEKTCLRQDQVAHVYSKTYYVMTSSKSDICRIENVACQLNDMYTSRLIVQ